MPIEVRAIRERRKRAEVKLGEEAAVILDYYPAKAALIGKEEIKHLAEESVGKPPREQRLILAHKLLELVASWDVTENGEPFPLDAEKIADTFDDAFLGFCIGSLIEDANTGKVSGELLSALGTVTTSPTGGAESSPAGKGDPISPPTASSRKSRSSAASRRGNSPNTRNGRRSSPHG